MIKGASAEDRIRRLEKLLASCRDAMAAEQNPKYRNTYPITDWSHMIDAIDAEVGITADIVQVEP